MYDLSKDPADNERVFSGRVVMEKKQLPGFWVFGWVFRHKNPRWVFVILHFLAFIILQSSFLVRFRHICNQLYLGTSWNFP